MFQEFALFPWKTVAGNVAWALKPRASRKNRSTRPFAYLSMIGLTEFRNHYPAEALRRHEAARRARSRPRLQSKSC